LTTIEEPEQVLAITFTRKAAAEMRERVQKALDGGGALRSAADTTTLEPRRRRASPWRPHGAGGSRTALRRLRIQTIDSFNAYLANAMPLTSAADSAAESLMPPEDLYALAARETLRQAESDGGSAPAFRAHPAPSRRQLDAAGTTHCRHVVAARRMAAEPAATVRGEPLVPRIEASLAIIVREELERAAAALPADFITLAGTVARVAARNRAEELADPKRADLARWLDFQRNLAAALRRPAALACVDCTGAHGKGLAADRDLQRRRVCPRTIPTRMRWRRRSPNYSNASDARQIASLQIIGMLPDPVIPEKARGALDALANYC
jgi:hypothetical protein